MSGRDFSEEEKHDLRKMIERESWRDENKQMLKEGNDFSECCCWPLITVVTIILLVGFLVGGFGFVRGHWEYFFPPSSR